MPLKRTFEELAAGHEDLLQLTEDLAGGLPSQDEADICDALVSLTCEDPQTPNTGGNLWNVLTEKFPEGADRPNFLSLLGAIQDQIGFLKELQYQAAERPATVQGVTRRVLVG